MSKYILLGQKRLVLGVLDRGKRGKNNETGLKEAGGIKIETTVLPLRDARSPSLLNYLPLIIVNTSVPWFCNHFLQSFQLVVPGSVGSSMPIM